MKLPEFRVLAAAAFVDGEFAAEEAALLSRLAERAGLSQSEAVKVIEETAAGSSPDVTWAATDRRRLYEAVLAMVTADHSLRPTESSFLDRVARALEIGADERQEAEARLLLQRLPAAPYIILLSAIAIAGLQFPIDPALGAEFPFAARLVAGLALLFLAGRSLVESWRQGFREGEGNPGFGEARTLGPEGLERSYRWSAFLFFGVAAVELIGQRSLALNAILQSDSKAAHPLFSEALASPVDFSLHWASTVTLGLVLAIFGHRAAELRARLTP